MLVKIDFKISGQYFTEKNVLDSESCKKSSVTYICQLLTNLYHISTIAVLGKMLHQIAAYDNLVNYDFVIIRLPLSQGWEKSHLKDEIHCQISTISKMRICFIQMRHSQLQQYPTCIFLCVSNIARTSVYLLRHISSFFYSNSYLSAPTFFPQGFSFWRGKSVKENNFTDTSFRFCSPTKSRMQHNLSESCSHKCLPHFHIVKWFRSNQWICAESHLTFSMIFFSILLLSILYLNPFMSGMHCESQASSGCLEIAGLS